MNQDTVHLLAGQKRDKDEYKDSHELIEVSKADIAGMMKAMEENL